jgi:hypothetical protein
MAGAIKHGGGCGCCNCPQTLCVYPRCGSTTGAIVSGYSVVVKSGATTIASGTTTSSGWCTTAITTTGTFTVEISKAGWPSTSTTVTYSTCGESKQATFAVCPTSFDVRVYVRALSCGSIPVPVSNATVLVNSVGVSTDANGYATATITPSGTCETMMSIGVTPPLDFGMDGASYSGTLTDLCTTPTYTFTLAPSSGHVVWMVCDGTFPGNLNCRYMPDTVTYTDNYGTATLTAPGPYDAFTGSYTWSSNHRVQIVACSEELPP